MPASYLCHDPIKVPGVSPKLVPSSVTSRSGQCVFLYEIMSDPTHPQTEPVRSATVVQCTPYKFEAWGITNCETNPLHQAPVPPLMLNLRNGPDHSAIHFSELTRSDRRPGLIGFVIRTGKSTASSLQRLAWSRNHRQLDETSHQLYAKSRQCTATTCARNGGQNGALAGVLSSALQSGGGMRTPGSDHELQYS